MKIAIIGAHNSILGFQTLGLDIYSAQKSQEALAILKVVVSEKKYAIVFITEDLAREIIEELEVISKVTLPAIITIPSHKGSFGVGLAKLRKTVERAVGSDILFRK